MPLLIEPDVSAKPGPPALALTRVAVLSEPTVSPDSWIRGMLCGLVNSRWCVLSSTCVVTLMPASSRTFFDSGFCHDSCRRRFGLMAFEPHDSGEVNPDTTPLQGS